MHCFASGTRWSPNTRDAASMCDCLFIRLIADHHFSQHLSCTFRNIIYLHGIIISWHIVHGMIFILILYGYIDIKTSQYCVCLCLSPFHLYHFLTWGNFSLSTDLKTTGSCTICKIPLFGLIPNRPQRGGILRWHICVELRHTEAAPHQLAPSASGLLSLQKWGLMMIPSISATGI